MRVWTGKCRMPIGMHIGACSELRDNECPKFCYYNTINVQTNYERLISKSPEEMAAFLSDHPVISSYDENNPNHKKWLEWLMKNANDDLEFIRQGGFNNDQKES